MIKYLLLCIKESCCTQSLLNQKPNITTYFLNENNVLVVLLLENFF